MDGSQPEERDDRGEPGGPRRRPSVEHNLEKDPLRTGEAGSADLRSEVASRGGSWRTADRFFGGWFIAGWILLIVLLGTVALVAVLYWQRDVARKIPLEDARWQTVREVLPSA